MPFNPPTFRPDPSFYQTDTGPSPLEKALDLIGQRGANVYNMYTQPTQEQKLNEIATQMIPGILSGQAAQAKAVSQEEALDKRLAQQIQLQEIKDAAMAERQKAQWDAALEKTLEAIRMRGETPYKSINLSVRTGGDTDQSSGQVANIVGGPHQGTSTIVPTTLIQVGTHPSGAPMFTSPGLPGDTLIVGKKALTPQAVPIDIKRESEQQKRVDDAIKGIQNRKTHYLRPEDAIADVEGVIARLGGQGAITALQMSALKEAARSKTLKVKGQSGYAGMQ